MNALVNKHNVRYSSEEDLRVTIETVMQSAKMYICCSMSESRVIGPYFVDDDTINRENSHSILKEFFVPELKRSGKASSAIFRQDEASFHLSRDVHQYFSAKSFPIGGWKGLVP